MKKFKTDQLSPILNDLSFVSSHFQFKQCAIITGNDKYNDKTDTSARFDCNVIAFNRNNTFAVSTSPVCNAIAARFV